MKWQTKHSRDNKTSQIVDMKWQTKHSRDNKMSQIVDVTWQTKQQGQQNVTDRRHDMANKT